MSNKSTVQHLYHSHRLSLIFVDRSIIIIQQYLVLWCALLYPTVPYYGSCFSLIGISTSQIQHGTVLTTYLIMDCKTFCSNFKFILKWCRFQNSGVMDAFKKSQEGTSKPHNPQIVIQLLWREFFYTMSVNNPYYGEMERNEICINIPWYSKDENDHFDKFCQGKTGYPLIGT